jgi:hypothetical protein
MDETLRFFIGIALFIAVITYEWLKERPTKRTS